MAALSCRAESTNVAASGSAEPQWFPQIATEGFKNLVPNSSFECGTANWGGFTYGLSGWAGNLYRLEGELDATTSQHGKHSLRISLSPKTEPVRYFDYFQPAREPIRRVLAANEGWIKVKPGVQLTLSAYLRGDTPGLVAQMIANEAPGHLLHHSVVVTAKWARYEFTFTPAASFLFIGVGLDLDESKRESGTLWLDAVQLEQGERASDYAPRAPVESFIETGVEGNIFTNLDRGASLTIRAFNDTGRPQRFDAKLEWKDFFDHPPVTIARTIFAQPNGETTITFGKLNQGRRGFFRADWKTPSGTQSVRCAVIQPMEASATNSPFGFNHAYPWQFLVRLARESGIVWWRDWSAQWQIVEPERGRFDFHQSDEQIHRVLELSNQVEVLLPFPSAKWSTTARPEVVARSAGSDNYLQARLTMAFAPADFADFGRYAAEVVRRYGHASSHPVTTFQILNEPVYTDYSLPEKFGYSLNDYLRLLQTAARDLKAADPRCLVVGGISANLQSGLTREFVSKGGLKFVDIFDLHIYDRPHPIEQDEAAFKALEELMRKHGGPKPLWITEWGCYAEDDPSVLPLTARDKSMDACLWKDERSASEHIVKFATVAFAHNVRKIFFHAGTCGAINASDPGGVLFEYGGAPRKMLPTISAFTRIVGVPDEFVERISEQGLTAYLFRYREGLAAPAGARTIAQPSVGLEDSSPSFRAPSSPKAHEKGGRMQSASRVSAASASDGKSSRYKERLVAVVWQEGDIARKLVLAPKVTAYDLMGNEFPKGGVELGASPIYLAATNLEELTRTINDAKNASR